MIKTPYRADSQDAARFSLPPFVRNTIAQVGDRQNGEYFSQYEGEHFYCETCDYPAQIVFVNGDRTMKYALHEGFTFRGPFKGIHIYHDSITLPAVPESINTPKIVFLSSKSAVVANDLHQPTTRLTAPFNLLETLGAGGQQRFQFPVGDQFRFISRLVVECKATLAAPYNGEARIRVLAFHNNVAMPSNNYSKNGVAYGQVSSAQLHLPPSAAQAVGNDVRLFFDIRDVPLPSWCTDAEAVVQLGAGNNVAAFTVNDLQAYFA